MNRSEIACCTRARLTIPPPLSSVPVYLLVALLFRHAFLSAFFFLPPSTNFSFPRLPPRFLSSQPLLSSPLTPRSLATSPLRDQPRRSLVLVFSGSFFASFSFSLGGRRNQPYRVCGHAACVCVPANKPRHPFRHRNSGRLFPRVFSLSSYSYYYREYSGEGKGRGDRKHRFRACPILTGYLGRGFCPILPFREFRGTEVNEQFRELFQGDTFVVDSNSRGRLTSSSNFFSIDRGR